MRTTPSESRTPLTISSTAVTVVSERGAWRIYQIHCFIIRPAHIVVDFLDDILSTVSGKPRPISSQLPMNKIPGTISANISSNWGIDFFCSRLKWILSQTSEQLTGLAWQNKLKPSYDLQSVQGMMQVSGINLASFVATNIKAESTSILTYSDSWQIERCATPLHPGKAGKSREVIKRNQKHGRLIYGLLLFIEDERRVADKTCKQVLCRRIM